MTSLDTAKMMAELEALKAENARLTAARNPGLTFKVSERGAVSVYGMGRFPTTLYDEQWDKLLSKADELRAFIAEHRAQIDALNTPELKAERKAQSKALRLAA